MKKKAVKEHNIGVNADCEKCFAKDVCKYKEVNDRLIAMISEINMADSPLVVSVDCKMRK